MLPSHINNTGFLASLSDKQLFKCEEGNLLSVWCAGKMPHFSSLDVGCKTVCCTLGINRRTFCLFPDLHVNTSPTNDKCLSSVSLPLGLFPEILKACANLALFMICEKGCGSNSLLANKHSSSLLTSPRVLFKIVRQLMKGSRSMSTKNHWRAKNPWDSSCKQSTHLSFWGPSQENQSFRRAVQCARKRPFVCLAMYSRPFWNWRWYVYIEDSLGNDVINVSWIHVGIFTTSTLGGCCCCCCCCRALPLFEVGPVVVVTQVLQLLPVVEVFGFLKPEEQQCSNHSSLPISKVLVWRTP